jgi:ribosomal protein S18 acetylase RimI-like enzyme
VTATLTIGPLTPHHRARIAEIVRATAVFSETEVEVALELFDDAMGGEKWDSASRVPHPTSDYEFIGAFGGDQLLGYACFGQTPSTDRTYDLYWIAVHPDAQRSGAGAALMNEVERQLAERRARLLIVETSSREDYVPTRSFYHKQGYAEAARLRGFYAPGDDRVVLTKRIDAATGVERDSSTTTSI